MEKLSGQTLKWDRNSTLYDSFELTSFQRHLDSALITSSDARSLSMPHHSSATSTSSPSSKLSRTFHKLLRSVFPKGKPKHADNQTTRWFVVYETTDNKNKGKAALSSIAEAGEAKFGKAVRKTLSERFADDDTLISRRLPLHLISSSA